MFDFQVIFLDRGGEPDFQVFDFENYPENFVRNFFVFSFTQIWPIFVTDVSTPSNCIFFTKIFSVLL